MGLGKFRLALLVIAALFVLVVPGCGRGNLDRGIPAAEDGVLLVHFIDVGQADSILVELPNGQNLLVDAGNNQDADLVTGYLRDRMITRLDYVVGTHPHEDHIGGLDVVIEGFEVGKVYLPRVVHNTNSFEDLLAVIKDKGLMIDTARAGVEIIEDGALKIHFVAPTNSRYEELNDYSAVTSIQYGETSFLLTGDAEAYSEHQMLAFGQQLDADVLKVGHHGSSSSTSEAFLRAVSPNFAVIMVGAGNDYGHPHRETLKLLSGAGITVYRTDLDGTVVMSSDGEDITVERPSI